MRPKIKHSQRSTKCVHNVTQRKLQKPGYLTNKDSAVVLFEFQRTEPSSRPSITPVQPTGYRCGGEELVGSVCRAPDPQPTVQPLRRFAANNGRLEADSRAAANGFISRVSEKRKGSKLSSSFRATGESPRFLAPQRAWGLKGRAKE